MKTKKYRCQVCGDRSGLKVNYAEGDGIEMMHPLCAARHYQRLWTILIQALMAIEPENAGEMPDDLWEAWESIRNDRQAVAKALLDVIAAMKSEILTRAGLVA